MVNSYRQIGKSKMKINERTFRRILREEALRELTGNNNRSVNLGLTLSEVSAL